MQAGGKPIVAHRQTGSAPWRFASVTRDARACSGGIASSDSTWATAREEDHRDGGQASVPGRHIGQRSSLLHAPGPPRSGKPGWPHTAHRRLSRRTPVRNGQHRSNCECPGASSSSQPAPNRTSDQSRRQSTEQPVRWHRRPNTRGRLARQGSATPCSSDEAPDENCDRSPQCAPENGPLAVISPR